jgi:opacity protein-like surface antigen
MIKQLVSSATLALGIALPATALAQGGAGDCPPGSWFCAQDSQQQPTPAGKPVGGLAPLPDPDTSAAPPAHGTIIYQAGSPPSEGAPPVVVYQPPPPVVIVKPEDAPPPPDYEYAPPPRPRSHHSEWGLNGHVEGAAFGHGSGDAGMGGAGLGLRFRPIPRIAIESDVDFVGGHDWQGDSRTEAALSFNGLLFLNPRSRAQIYLIAGFGWTAAHVTNDASSSSSLDAHYNYFGGQGGAGLEIRLSRNFALNGDIRGFIRGRTDRLADSQPEFTNADGRTTNTSGGALFTGGLTLYF